MTEPHEPIVLLPGSRPGTWLRLRGCQRVWMARERDEVEAVLEQAEGGAGRGLRVAGFVTYEAAPAFDAALTTHPRGPLPLAWFAAFESAEEVPSLPESNQPHDSAWQDAMPFEDYEKAVATIHRAIERGETYQVNFTFPLRRRLAGNESRLALFRRLVAAQRGELGAFIETDSFAICSASPELFFALDDDRITCRPMKGTSPRGRSSEEDEHRKEALLASEKNRAENLMIVDMVRNDLGRIALPGTVHTTSLFDVERYPNVLQMTSTVEARTSASLSGIFRALFPSASVTGAPKVQTCGLIRQLETGPRAVYTGAIGWIGPGRKAAFNVAIRTVQIDKEAAEASYGTGSGVVWDSEARAEYEECRAKASVLKAEPWPEFQCLETLRWDISKGWNFLAEHLDRLARSARYFGFSCDLDAVRAALESSVIGSRQSLRVRLTLNAAGVPSVRTEVWTQAALFEARPPAAPPFLRAAIVADSARTTDIFLHHKTTHRKAYEAARARCPQVEEVLLVNERGELTEGTIGNIVLVLDGNWVTPAATSGLLPGVFRRILLDRADIVEAVLSPYDMQRADAAYLINSVRGWRRLAMRG